MHWIERRILQTLLRVDVASAKDLIPSGIEANLASHYLRRLISLHYVTKVMRGKYALTSEGQRYVGEMNSLTGQIGKNLKAVIMLYAEDQNGRPLFFRWSRQPYLGQITLPHDRVAYGDSLEVSLETAMTEKLGAVYPTEFVAAGFVKIVHQESITSHMGAFLYKVTVDDAKFPYESRNGIASFDFHLEDAMQGIEQLLKLIQLPDPKVFDVVLSY